MTQNLWWGLINFFTWITYPFDVNLQGIFLTFYLFTHLSFYQSVTYSLIVNSLVIFFLFYLFIHLLICSCTFSSVHFPSVHPFFFQRFVIIFVCTVSFRNNFLKERIIINLFRPNKLGAKKSNQANQQILNRRILFEERGKPGRQLWSHHCVVHQSFIYLSIHPSIRPFR